MNKISIVSMGPGNIDYMLPIAIKRLKESDIIIGGKRNLESVSFLKKETKILNSNLTDTMDFIKDNYEQKKISVIVSGDAGFYSILKFMHNFFTKDRIDIIPGISSIQYMAGKIGEYWHDAVLLSLHGRDTDLINFVKNNGKVFCLTDSKNTPQNIAGILTQNEFGNKLMYIGNNLSYDDEKIIKDYAKNIINDKNNYDLSVVVITDE